MPLPVTGGSGMRSPDARRRYPIAIPFGHPASERLKANTAWPALLISRPSPRTKPAGAETRVKFPAASHIAASTPALPTDSPASFTPRAAPHVAAPTPRLVGWPGVFPAMLHLTGNDVAPAEPTTYRVVPLLIANAFPPSPASA